MRLRPDWLSNALTVAYVPTLGPVHPRAATPAVFHDVFTAQPGRFLPYDKAARWSNRKDETVLVNQIQHTAAQTIIPTVTLRRGQVTAYHYAAAPPDPRGAQDHIRKLAADCGVSAGRIVWFQHARPPAAVRCVRVMLADTTRPDPRPTPHVDVLDDCPPAVRATFAAFAARTGDGLAHLARCLAAGMVTGPVLVAVDGDVVVGAIGPLHTWPGPDGRRQLLPQYFTVLPDHRRAGHGRALWRAAQHWGHTHHAAYQVLQVVPDSPAETLYCGEGVHALGYVCTAAA